MHPKSFLQKTFGVHYIYKEKEKKYYAAMIKYINLLSDGYNA